MTDTPKDGGPAFPTPEIEKQIAGTTVTIAATPGASLRDLFAGQALTGLVMTIPGPGCADWDYYAVAAYHIADAMLAARKVGS